jgi:hypothetical protein
MKRNNHRKRIMSFVFALIAAIIPTFFLSLCLPAPASSEEIYRFERMWPTLQQPWYFSQPSGVAVDSNGCVFVLDSDLQRIQKFTSEGRFVTKWGSRGTGDGQFY